MLMSEDLCNSISEKNANGKQNNCKNNDNNNNNNNNDNKMTTKKKMAGSAVTLSLLWLAINK